MSTYLMIQRVKEPSGKGSSFMLGTSNLHYQKGLLAPPKSKQAGRVQDLVASESNVFLALLQNSKIKELLAIM